MIETFPAAVAFWRGGAHLHQIAGIGEQGLGLHQVAVEAGDKLPVEIGHTGTVAGSLQGIAQRQHFLHCQLRPTSGKLETAQGIGCCRNHVAAAQFDPQQAQEGGAAGWGVFVQAQEDRLCLPQRTGGQQRFTQRQCAWCIGEPGLSSWRNLARDAGQLSRRRQRRLRLPGSQAQPQKLTLRRQAGLAGQPRFQQADRLGAASQPMQGGGALQQLRRRQGVQRIEAGQRAGVVLPAQQEIDHAFAGIAGESCVCGRRQGQSLQ